MNENVKRIAKEIFNAANEANVLCVHGVWSRFFPAMQKVRDLIDAGEIGEIRPARASFCQNDGAGSCSALLETGIYCAQFLQWALGDPSGASEPMVRGACRTIHESGNDEHVTAIIEFPGKNLDSSRRESHRMFALSFHPPIANFLPNELCSIKIFVCLLTKESTFLLMLHNVAV